MTKRLFISASLLLFLLPLFTFAQTAPICSVTRSLSRGMSGADVTTLQTFLKTEGHFTVTPTGYFGPITEASLANWQLKVGIITSIVDGGVYGPRSRAYVNNKWCGGTAQTTTSTNQCPKTPAFPTQTSCSGSWNKTYNATQCHVGWTCVTMPQPTASNKPPFISAITGSTKLKTNESGTWQVTASDPEKDVLSFSIIWGDEGALTAQLLELAGLGTGATRTTSFSHSYTTGGYYTIVIFARDTANNDTKATFSVTVEAPPPPPLPPPINVNTSTNTNTNNTNGGGAGCVYNGQTYSEGTATEGFSPTNLCLPSTICQNRTAYIPTFTCRSGQWVSGAQTNTSCTFANTPIGSYCGGLCHGVGGLGPNDTWSSPCQLAW